MQKAKNVVNPVDNLHSWGRRGPCWPCRIDTLAAAVAELRRDLHSVTERVAHIAPAERSVVELARHRYSIRPTAQVQPSNCPDAPS